MREREKRRKMLADEEEKKRVTNAAVKLAKRAAKFAEKLAVKVDGVVKLALKMKKRLEEREERRKIAKAAKAEKKKTEREKRSKLSFFARLRKYSPQTKIALVKKNPWKSGTKRFRHYNHRKFAKTIREYRDLGGTCADMRQVFLHGYGHFTGCLLYTSPSPRD